MMLTSLIQAGSSTESGVWPLVPLGEVTENFDCRRAPVKELERKPGSFPYYGASGVVDHVDSYLFDGEYLLIGEDGENLRTRQTPIAFLAKGKFWVNNHAHIVLGNHRADTLFLKYAVSQADISPYLTGSTMPKLSQGNLNRIPIPLPPLPEQRRIAKILGDLDDKIELNRTMNETLEQMARALFKSWFVDFDPVRAKMEGRTPTGMDAATAALFPDRLVDSELGMIPEGWEVKALGEVMDIARQSINPAVQPFKVFAHYSLPAFDNGRVPVRQPGDEIKSNKLLLTDGSVLISKLNPHIPRVWLPTLNPTERSVCSTEFIVAIAGPSISQEYLYCLFGSDNFQQTYQGLATGTTGSHQRIQAESLLSLLQVLPHGEVVSVFTSKMKSMVTAINQNIHQSRTLVTLRDTLLPKLVSGEVRVGGGDHLGAS